MATNFDLNDIGNIKNKRQYTIDNMLNLNPPSDLKTQNMEPVTFSSSNAQPVEQSLPKINLPSVEEIKQNNNPIESTIVPPSKENPFIVNEKDQALKSILDPYINKYQKQQNDLQNNRQAEISKLSDMDKMSNDEKMAQALLAILPGLIGAGLGAAAVGGVGGSAGLGALQGLSGGLQGSTSSLQNIKQEKQQKRQEIRENIKNIDDKLEKSGLKEETRADLLEERKIQEDRFTNQFANQMALEKVKQSFESGQLNKKIAADAENAIRQGEIQKAVTILNNNSSEKREGMQNATSLEVARIYSSAQRFAAGLNATGKAEKLSEGQQKAAFFISNIVDAEKKLQANKDSYDPTSRLQLPNTAPDTLKSADRLAYESNLLSWLNSINYLRSGAGQGELEFSRSKIELFPVPGDDAKTITEKAEKRQAMIENAAKAYNITNKVDVPNFKNNLDVDDQKLINFAKNNPNDPRSAVIKQHYGL